MGRPDGKGAARLPHAGMTVDWRSLLFVPADDAARVAKAAQSDAHAVILDLEDGVAPSAKAGARAALTERVATVRAGEKAAVVRINAPWLLAVEDLAAAAAAGATAVMVPKVETGARLEIVGEMLAEHEAALGSPAGSIAIVALVESARGLSAAPAIATAPRVIALALGSEDFSLDMGVPPTPALLDLPCRRLALAAAEAGIGAFVLPVSIAAFRDEAGIEQAARAARGYGGHGALCIHPIQVGIVNRAFAPTEQELEHARAVLVAWDKACGDGAGVATVDGRMVDAPVAERAARLIARSKRQEGQTR